MMKNLKKFKIICLILAVCMMFSILPVWGIENEHDSKLVYESLGSIQATLTSAIDGSPFYAYYDSETGKVSSVSMNGESMGYRYVDSEEAFWELVAFNAEVTSKPIEERIGTERMNRNASWIDEETGMLIEYDEHGNRTETYLTEITQKPEVSAEAAVADVTPPTAMLAPQEVTGISPEVGTVAEPGFVGVAPTSFDTGWLNVSVPFTGGPGLSGATVGGYRNTDSNTTYVVLETGYSLPYNSVIDVYFTNQIGDDFSSYVNLGVNTSKKHSVYFKGEPYAALVNLYNGTIGGFAPVSLRFYTEQLTQASTNISIQNMETLVPQNLNAVSTSLPSTSVNACYDYNSSYRPYYSLSSIDYNGTWSGTKQDRVLRQTRVLITVRNGTTPLSNVTVSVSASGSSSAWAYTRNATTNSSGQVTAYIEHYGNESFTLTATANSTSASSTIYYSGAQYMNKFYVTFYNWAKRSDYSSWSAFEAAVRMQGSGYDDWTYTWYTLDWSPNAPSPRPVIPVSSTPSNASGLVSGEYRSLAVDPQYITMARYVSSGSTSNVWHRGYLAISGASLVSGDSGYRTAEDTGGAIKGYHVDIFAGFKSMSEVINLYNGRIPTLNGHFFTNLTYWSTLKN